MVIFKFILTGGLRFLALIFLFHILTLNGLDRNLTVFITWFIGIIVNILAHTRFVYRTEVTLTLIKEYFKLYSAVPLANIGLLFVFVDLLSLHLLLSQTVSILLLSVVTFFATKKINEHKI